MTDKEKNVKKKPCKPQSWFISRSKEITSACFVKM